MNFPVTFIDFFNDKLNCLPVLSLVGRQGSYVDYITLEDLGLNHAMRYVDDYGRLGLVKRNPNGSITTLFQQCTTAPSAWIVLTYRCMRNEEGHYLRKVDDLIDWVEPIGKQIAVEKVVVRN